MLARASRPIACPDRHHHSGGARGFRSGKKIPSGEAFSWNYFFPAANGMDMIEKILNCHEGVNFLQNLISPYKLARAVRDVLDDISARASHG